MNKIRYFLLGLACLFSMAASAQWQWLDKDGHKVFSDRAPPPEVLEKDILKRPNVMATSPAPVLAPQSSASTPRPAGVDKELAEKKKKFEEAEKAKRQAEQDRGLKAKGENCARAKQARASLDSKWPIARVNEKGERELLDASARAAELQRVQSIMDSDCN